MRAKSKILADDTTCVLLPGREVLDIIFEIEILQGIALLLNLIWFLANQITLEMLIKAAIMTILP